LPPFFSPTSRWTFPAHPDLIAAAQTGFAGRNAYPVDLRGLSYSYAYIGIKRLGAGQFYLISIHDKDGEPYDGKTYRLHVPPNVPIEQYWSWTAYDRQTHALIKNMPRVSRASNAAEVHKNTDGSVDIYVGPKTPPDKGNELGADRSAARLRANVPLLGAEEGVLREDLGAAGR
jgi:hypothetical protein